jgi:hypothetical protein
MSVQIRKLDHSANGDRWCLANDSASGRVFVRYEPNLAFRRQDFISTSEPFSAA